jgi:hypothetical protein
MPDESTQDAMRRAQLAFVPRANRATPSSSRMFASYLIDIEQLRDEQRWDAALREAFDLPRIAVALADPELRCSVEQVKAWCAEWIRPPGADRDAQGLDFEHLIRALTDRVAQVAARDVVPMKALRRLQLRRHLRSTPPRGLSPLRTDYLRAQDAERLEMCTALLEAARRWYAGSACHDATVQANLARLAVLR